MANLLYAKGIRSSYYGGIETCRLTESVVKLLRSRGGFVVFYGVFVHLGQPLLDPSEGGRSLCL